MHPNSFSITIKATRCQKRIEFYEQHLQRLTAPGKQDLETKQLLKKYTLKDEKTPVDKNLAFQRAAAMGHLDDLTKLLFLGARINDQGSGSKKTALHHAAIKNQFNTFMSLMSHQANISIKDHDGKIAFDYIIACFTLFAVREQRTLYYSQFENHELRMVKISPKIYQLFKMSIFGKTKLYAKVYKIVHF